MKAYELFAKMKDYSLMPKDEATSKKISNNVYPTKVWGIGDPECGKDISIFFIRDREPFSVKLKELHDNHPIIMELNPKDACSVGASIARYLHLR